MAGVSYFYIYKDKAEQWRWSFNAENGEIIGVSSEAYHNLVDCEYSVSLIKTQGPNSVTVGDDNYKKLRS